MKGRVFHWYSFFKLLGLPKFRKEIDEFVQKNEGCKNVLILKQPLKSDPFCLLESQDGDVEIFICFHYLTLSPCPKVQKGVARLPPESFLESQASQHVKIWKIIQRRNRNHPHCPSLGPSILVRVRRGHKKITETEISCTKSWCWKMGTNRNTPRRVWKLR